MFGKTKKATDPVCGMSIDPASAPAQIEHAGQTYHFCSQHCADSFVADPGRFATQGSTR